MRGNEQMTLVHASQGQEFFWSLMPQSMNIITVPNLNLLAAALKSMVEHQRDVRKVILDGSVTAEQFLPFLAGLPEDFRGDVVMIARDGSGYLSALAHRDTRMLYRMTQTDVEFYRDVNFSGFGSNDASFVPETVFRQAPAYF